jgi:acyl-coenzyme A synthetase/AMP-(fatty) acid ligase
MFLPDTDGRPAAAVVAPGLTAAAILHELRMHIDGAFVPRPLIIVDALPRNSVGKLLREELLGLLAKARS